MTSPRSASRTPVVLLVLAGCAPAAGCGPVAAGLYWLMVQFGSLLLKTAITMAIEKAVEQVLTGAFFEKKEDVGRVVVDAGDPLHGVYRGRMSVSVVSDKDQRTLDSFELVDPRVVRDAPDGGRWRVDPAVIERAKKALKGAGIPGT